MRACPSVARERSAQTLRDHSGPFRINVVVFSQCNNGVNIDNRPTEKGLETRQIYPGIDVTMEIERALR